MGLFRKKAPSRNRRRIDRIPERKAMIVLNDVSFGLVDWSVDGFRALGYRGGLSRGAEVRAKLVLIHKGSPAHFEGTARISHESPETGEIGAEFTDMSAATRQKLEKVYAERLARLESRDRQREQA